MWRPLLIQPPVLLRTSVTSTVQQTLKSDTFNKVSDKYQWADEFHTGTTSRTSVIICPSLCSTHTDHSGVKLISCSAIFSHGVCWEENAKCQWGVIITIVESTSTDAFLTQLHWSTGRKKIHFHIFSKLGHSASEKAPPEELWMIRFQPSSVPYLLLCSLRIMWHQNSGKSNEKVELYKNIQTFIHSFSQHSPKTQWTHLHDNRCGDAQHRVTDCFFGVYEEINK